MAGAEVAAAAEAEVGRVAKADEETMGGTSLEMRVAKVYTHL